MEEKQTFIEINLIGFTNLHSELTWTLTTYVTISKPSEPPYYLYTVKCPPNTTSTPYTAKELLRNSENVYGSTQEAIQNITWFYSVYNIAVFRSLTSTERSYKLLDCYPE